MKFATVCSGIEAASLACQPLGWECEFVAEIDPSACFVLAHHYGASRPRYMPSPDEPDLKPKERRARMAAMKAVREIPETTTGVKNLGDFTQIQEGDHRPIDALFGGTPCQSFSVAGLRGGLADARGNLALAYLRLADRTRPRWLVWENVPGVLSSNGGRDFGAILGGMVKLGYGIAYRVLDAQFVRVDGFPRAVPQRRRRVVVVGYLGDWRRAAAVLFERASLLGDSPPGRETGESIAGSLGGSSQSGGFRTTDLDNSGAFIPEVSHPLLAKGNDSFDSTLQSYVPQIMAQAITSKIAKGSSGPAGDEHHHLIAFSSKDNGRDATEGVSPTLRAMPHDGSHPNGGGQMAIAIQERAVSENPEAGPDGVGARDDGAAHTLEARTTAQAVAFKASHYTRGKDGAPSDVAFPLSADADKGDQDPLLLAPSIGHNNPPKPIWRVRRLTPRECERLQAIPDDYTLVPGRRGRPMPDGPRYKMLGNTWAVNQFRWVFRRLEMVDQMMAATEVKL